MGDKLRKFRKDTRYPHLRSEGLRATGTSRRVEALRSGSGHDGRYRQGLGYDLRNLITLPPIAPHFLREWLRWPSVPEGFHSVFALPTFASPFGEGR